MNVFDILEEIMEALADGRKEGETTAQFRDRKAGELEQHFAEKRQKAEAEQKIATKQAENAKKEFEKKPTAEAGQKAIDASLKALEVANKGTEAGQKEYKVQKIRRKIDWRKSMSEALEIMEEIMNKIDEGRKEGESLEDFKKRLGDKEFNKQYDKYIDLTKKVIYSDKHDRRHRPHKGMSQRTHDLEAERNKAFTKKELAGVIASGATSWPHKSKSREERMDNDYNDLKAEMRANNKTHEALSLMEQICNYADNLFELDYEEKQNISPNEISRVKKNKKGERVEVVSVADELFPYEGDAKQQFNQKVLAKINDMIEGTGSLEDLIQFVRAGAKAKASKAHEALDEGKEPNKECEYRKAKWEEATQKYFDTKKKNMDFEGKHPETKKAYDEERKAYANLDKARRDSKKINGPYESLEQALSLLEGAIKDFFLGTEKKDPATKSAVGRTLRGKEATYNKHVDDIAKYSKRAKGAKGYRAQVNQEKAADAERKATEANKDLRKTKGEYLDILRKDKGLTNPQAHAVLKRAVGESVQEMLELVEGLFVKDNRGDLLDDIDTALGSPVKKKIRDIKNRMTGCKETKVHEAFELMEQILMETSYERKMELLRKREENADQANVNAFKDLIRGYVVGATPEEKAKAEQDFAKSQAKNLEAQGKLNKARRLVQNSGKKKVNEALDLMEEIINELNDEVKVKAGIKRLENARNAYQDFKDSGKNLDNAKKEWQQARDKYSALRAEKKMKVGDSLRAEGEFRDKYFQANKDFYQKHDDAQAANNKLKRFSKVQNIKDPKAASDLKQEVDKFRQENK